MSNPGKMILLLAALLLISAGVVRRSGAVEPGEKTRVCVSIAPAKFLLERLGNGQVDILVLVDKGADPHSFEPKPGQLKSIHDADLYFSIGLPFEEIWTKRFKELSPHLRIVDLGQGIEHLPLERGRDRDQAQAHSTHGTHDTHGTSAEKFDAVSQRPEAGHEAAHEHGAEDPHLWSSPANMKKMALTASAALISVRPELAPEIKANLAALNREIDAVDAKIRELLSQLPPDKRTFMVFHPAWAYYAKEYGLRELAVEQEGREAGPRKLKELAEDAAEAKVSLMVVQPRFSLRMAESLAASLGLRVVTLDPLSEDWPGALLGLARAMASTAGGPDIAGPDSAASSDSTEKNKTGQ